MATKSLWDIMLTEERRARARTLGLRVSDLEEMEALQSTLAQSQLEEDVSRLRADGDEREMATSPPDELKEDLEEVRLPACVVHGDALVPSTPSAAAVDDTGGPWILLPVELVDKILTYLSDPDMCGYIMMVSKSVFRPSDRVFRYLCELIYPRQTIKKAAVLERWPSWKVMLIERPRLRTNGFYTLRTTYSKQHCNDQFWEERVHECIEVKYYRHFRFFDYGRVLYSLDITEPYDMARLLLPGQPVAKKIYEGTYQLSRRRLVVNVALHYCQMMFELLLLDGDDGYQGKHNMLTLTAHSSVARDGVTPLANYTIPVMANFRFHRVWGFSARNSEQRVTSSGVP